MNKVILTGRLTKDPEQRMTQSNLEIARFTVAAQGDYSNKNGERAVEFINCVAFNATAGIINKYCKKGSLIGIQGRIKNGSYDAQDGTKRYTTDVVVEQFEFLGSKSNGSNDNFSSAANDYQPSTNDASNQNIETTDISEDPYKDFGDEITLSSDDLPF